MRIEVLCTGDELLTGLTADTNSPFFMGKLLSELGERVVRAEVVGDVREDITRAISECAARCDAVLVSGGLGPTADDLTAECAAAAQGVPLLEEAAVLASIKRRFEKRGLEFTPNNAKQALVPKGAEVVHNPVGTAPMFIQRIGRCTLFYVPGVPREYKHLVEHAVLPRLRSMLEKEEGRVFRAFKLLKTIGLPESHLDAMVAPLARTHTRVVFGFRTHLPENHLKLLAEGKSQQEADEALKAAEGDCKTVLGHFLFSDREAPYVAALGELLRIKGKTVAVAESCTGGLISQLLTSPAGASEYFAGGAAVYHEGLKHKWARVKEQTLREHGAVSREVALEMARGIREELGASYGISVTGFAGPTGGTEKDPVGTVYCALSDGVTELCERQVHVGDRDRIRELSAYAALELLRRTLVGAKPP